jgi:hypothetical protein
MAALAAAALLDNGSRAAATWVVLSGLFISVISLLMLPCVVEGNPKPEPASLLK